MAKARSSAQGDLWQLALSSVVAGSLVVSLMFNVPCTHLAQDRKKNTSRAFMVAELFA